MNPREEPIIRMLRKKNPEFVELHYTSRKDLFSNSKANRNAKGSKITRKGQRVHQ